MSSICLNFGDLRDLHLSVNDLLHSPQFKQALIYQQHDDSVMSLVQEVSEVSIKMLDLCSATNDVFNLVKEHLQEIKQSFRKSKIEGSSNLESRISDHRLCRKKLKKMVDKSLRDIKGIKSDCFTSDLSLIDHSLIVIVHVLREVKGATISILESLSSLITLPTNLTIFESQTTFALKLIMQMKCQRILLERCNSMEVCMANKIKEVISEVGKLEVELGSIIRRLMHTRVLLLNVLTN